MPNLLDILKQGISETSSQIKNKGLEGWMGEKSAEVGRMFGNAAVDLAARELDLNADEINQLKNFKDNAEALKKLKDQLGDVNLSDVDPELVKKNIEYLAKTDLSKTGLGTETAKEIVQEEAPKVVVEQTTTTTVPKVEQAVPSVTPGAVNKFSILDLNKNGKISDDLLKVGLGVAGAAALGYGAHKLYKHFKNKRAHKDMSIFDLFKKKSKVPGLSQEDLDDDIAYFEGYVSDSGEEDFDKALQKGAKEFDNYSKRKYGKSYKELTGRDILDVYWEDMDNNLSSFSEKKDMSEHVMLAYLDDKNPGLSKQARDTMKSYWLADPVSNKDVKYTGNSYYEWADQMDNLIDNSVAARWSPYPSFKKYNDKQFKNKYNNLFLSNEVWKNGPGDKEWVDFFDNNTGIASKHRKSKAQDIFLDKYDNKLKELGIRVGYGDKDMSEQSKKKGSLGKTLALGILGAAGAYGMYKLGAHNTMNKVMDNISANLNGHGIDPSVGESLYKSIHPNTQLPYVSGSNPRHYLTGEDIAKYFKIK